MHSKPPSRIASSVFTAKAVVLRGMRFVSDMTHPVRSFPHGRQSNYPELLAECRSPLWTAESVVENGLQFGKVQNLRRACRRLHLAEIPKNEIFSFWKQVGKARISDGYTRGRELRQGCLIPSVGGGLCQLSNSLYDLALNTDCEIVERHAHTAVVPGSAAEQGRDATIFWNYVDFRFRLRQDTLLTATLTHDELVLRFWGKQRLFMIGGVHVETRQASYINTCTDCGVSECFRHVPAHAVKVSGSTAYLMEECWPEFEEYIASIKSSSDDLFLPWYSSLKPIARYKWNTTGYRRTITANAQTIASTLKSRFINRDLPPVAAQLERSRALADYYSRHLPPEATHLYVAQSLLPFLWHNGDLGGRTFSVLMTRLPLHNLHRRLDALAQEFPERKTFQEFRAPEWMAQAEAEALEQAEHIITPHSEFAALFQHNAIPLGWKFSSVKASNGGKHVVFPGPVLARKGAFELREAAQELDCPIMVLNQTIESEDFWIGVRLLPATKDWLSNAAVVVQPAFIENNPRVLLRALAAGVSVIATPECGIANHPLLTLVPAGNAVVLRNALQKILHGERRRSQTSDFCAKVF